MQSNVPTSETISSTGTSKIESTVPPLIRRTIETVSSSSISTQQSNNRPTQKSNPLAQPSQDWRKTILVGKKELRIP